MTVTLINTVWLRRDMGTDAAPAAPLSKTATPLFSSTYGVVDTDPGVYAQPGVWLGAYSCVQSLDPPPGWTGGPYDTAAACEAECNPP